MHLESSEQEYEVEEIRQEKFFKGKPYYLIKWKGFPQQQCTWEPIENLENSLTYLIEWKKQKLVDIQKEKSFKVGPRENSFLQERQFNFHIKNSKKISKQKPWKNLIGNQKPNQILDENGMKKTQRKLKRPVQDSDDEELNIQKFKIHKILKQNQEPIVKIQANSSNRSRPMNANNAQNQQRKVIKQKNVKIEELSPQKIFTQVQPVRSISSQPQPQSRQPIKSTINNQQEKQFQVDQEQVHQSIQQQISHGKLQHKNLQVCIQEQKKLSESKQKPEKENAEQRSETNFNNENSKADSHVNQNSVNSSCKPDGIQQASTAIRQVQLSPISKLYDFKQVQKFQIENEVIEPFKDIEIIQHPAGLQVQKISKMVYICSRKYFEAQLSDGKNILLSHENTKKYFTFQLCEYYELFIIDIPFSQNQKPSL